MPNPTHVDYARVFAAVFLPAGISERGGHVVYKANVKEIITEPLPAEEASSSSSGADVQATGGPCFEMFLAVCVCESGGGGVVLNGTCSCKERMHLTCLHVHSQVELWDSWILRPTACVGLSCMSGKPKLSCTATCACWWGCHQGAAYTLSTSTPAAVVY